MLFDGRDDAITRDGEEKMFTGLIEEKGIIKNLDIKGSSGTISISCAEVLKDTKIGDSIAVDGWETTAYALDGVLGVTE